MNYAEPGSNMSLFDVFDKIKELNGDLFHFGKCTKPVHNSEEKVVDVIRDFVIYISLYVRVMLPVIVLEPVMFDLSKNHDKDPSNAVLASEVTSTPSGIQSVRLQGRINVTA